MAGANERIVKQKSRSWSGQKISSRKILVGAKDLIAKDLGRGKRSHCERSLTGRTNSSSAKDSRRDNRNLRRQAISLSPEDLGRGSDLCTRERYTITCASGLTTALWQSTVLAGTKERSVSKISSPVRKNASPVKETWSILGRGERTLRRPKILAETKDVFVRKKTLLGRKIFSSAKDLGRDKRTLSAKALTCIGKI